VRDRTDQRGPSGADPHRAGPYSASGLRPSAASPAAGERVRSGWCPGGHRRHLCGRHRRDGPPGGDRTGIHTAAPRPRRRRCGGRGRAGAPAGHDRRGRAGAPAGHDRRGRTMPLKPAPQTLLSSAAPRADRNREEARPAGRRAERRHHLPSSSPAPRLSAGCCAHSCADIAVRTSMEPGANAPFIVCADADLDGVGYVSPRDRPDTRLLTHGADRPAPGCPSPGPGCGASVHQ
jgi:hypothetical protein